MGGWGGGWMEDAFKKQITEALAACFVIVFESFFVALKRVIAEGLESSRSSVGISRGGFHVGRLGPVVRYMSSSRGFLFGRLSGGSQDMTKSDLVSLKENARNSSVPLSHDGTKRLLSGGGGDRHEAKRLHHTNQVFDMRHANQVLDMIASDPNLRPEGTFL